MSEVKTFKIIGQIKKGTANIPFTVEYNALKEEHARERMYAEMGSRHGARRSEIKITKIEEAEQQSVPAKA